MTSSALQQARMLASPRHRRRSPGGDGLEVLALLLRLASVATLAGIGWVHLHLWQDGYRGIPTIGPLFIAAAVGTTVLGTVLLVRPSRLVAVSAIGTAVGILGGLLVSVNVGLFGFRDSLSAPFAVESIVIEMAAALTLAAWTALDLALEYRRAGGRQADTTSPAVNTPTIDLRRSPCTPTSTSERNPSTCPSFVPNATPESRPTAPVGARPPRPTTRYCEPPVS